jgi:hypothetical protein
VDTSNPILEELLDAGVGDNATTTNGLTNHLPMALVAKAGLGASPDELRRFATKYRAARLAPTREPSERLTRATWRRAVGNPDAYAELVRYFDDEIREHGSEETMRTHFEVLIDGVSGAAFHGVIRLAYALDVNAPERVATGLAYLASTAMALGLLDGGSPVTDDPITVLNALAEKPVWGALEGARLIDTRMRLVSQQPEFAGVGASLAIDEDTPQRLADLALHLYASTDDFTALHGVTGLEAISRLRPYVDDVERLDRATFQALAAAYLTIGAPALWSSDRMDEMSATRSVDDATVARRASLSNDEHVAKIVFTSLRRFDETRDPLYRAVAERAVRLDESFADDGSLSC